MTGPTNAGLAEVANIALISLLQTTVALIVEGAPNGPTPSALVALKAVQQILDDAGEAFASAEDSVSRSEQRYQEKRARKAHLRWLRRGSSPHPGA